MRLEIRNLKGRDIKDGDSVPDVYKFQGLMIVDIARVDTDESQEFKFVVLTISEVVSINGGFWGRGILILPSFSWEKVHAWIMSLLSDISVETWDEVMIELNKNLLFINESKLI